MKKITFWSNPIYIYGFLFFSVCFVYVLGVVPKRAFPKIRSLRFIPTLSSKHAIAIVLALIFRTLIHFDYFKIIF